MFADMDDAKIRFLFGHLPEDGDPDDPDDRALLLARSFGVEEPGGPLTSFRLAVAETLAAQIAEERPPEVWSTAQRLLALGQDRERVMRQLALALLPEMRRATFDGESFEERRYLDALSRLPLPSGEEIERALVEGARRRPGIDVDDLERQVADELGFDLEEEPYEGLMDQVSDAVFDRGSLVLLSEDRVVDPLALCADAVLTHRLSDSEISTGYLSVGVDLVGFARLEEPLRTAEGMELHPFSVEERHRAWAGPPGWLDRFEPGTLLAVRRLPDEDASVVSLEPLGAEPAPDEELVRTLSAVAEEELDDLPVACEDLLLGMLLARAGCFSVHRPPLRDLIEAAGLERRGGCVAHGPEAWATEEALRRYGRLMRYFGAHHTKVIIELLDAFEDDEARPDDTDLRRLLRELSDVDVLAGAADELFGPDEDRGRAADVLEFTERLSDAAHAPVERAVAAWFRAVALERLGEVADAEACLREAVAVAPQWRPAIDRAAWYCFDRGNAEDALRLWRRTGADAAGSPDVALLESVVGPSGPEPGRNQPCWCGSGRKFKHCHLGRRAELSLADRARWLRRKALAYVERRGGGPKEMVLRLATVRAMVAEDDDGPDASAVEEALEDGAVIDIALTEGGWFERFLTERGPLLPDDEALLGASWALVPRTIYEVEGPDDGALVVRDLRSAEEVTLHAPPASVPRQRGSVLCAHAVPVDGNRHMLVGFAFPVAPGTETALFEVLDSSDPYELAAYMGARDRPPQLATREGEPVVRCEAVLEVDDAAAARAVLDRLYERRDEEDSWAEMHELAPGDRVLRATLGIEGKRITVSTMSEERLDRVLEVLRGQLGEHRTVSVEREPFEQLRHRVGGRARTDEPIEVDPALKAQVQDQFEERWCDESVPALGGLTPRQAASDPSRREILERLLRDFEQHDERVPAGGITMRTSRLRELLDVPS
jgi:tetratricopeptide (TPR) repeat protein